MDRKFRRVSQVNRGNNNDVLENNIYILPFRANVSVTYETKTFLDEAGILYNKTNLFRFWILHKYIIFTVEGKNEIE